MNADRLRVPPSTIPRTRICKRSCASGCNCDKDAEVVWNGPGAPVTVMSGKELRAANHGSAVEGRHGPGGVEADKIAGEPAARSQKKKKGWIELIETDDFFDLVTVKDMGEQATWIESGSDSAETEEARRCGTGVAILGQQLRVVAQGSLVGLSGATTISVGNGSLPADINDGSNMQLRRSCRYTG